MICVLPCSSVFQRDNGRLKVCSADNLSIESASENDSERG